MTHLELKLVDYFLHNLSLKFLQKSFFGTICFKIHYNSISQGHSNLDCGAHNWPIFTYKVSKEALLIELWYFQIFLIKIIGFKGFTDRQKSGYFSLMKYWRNLCICNEWIIDGLLFTLDKILMETTFKFKALCIALLLTPFES